MRRGEGPGRLFVAGRFFKESAAYSRLGAFSRLDVCWNRNRGEGGAGRAIALPLFLKFIKWLLRKPL